MSWGAAIGGIAGGLLGGGSGQDDIKTEFRPWSRAARQGLNTAAEGALDLYNNYRQMYYPGVMTAPLNPYQIAGSNYLQGYAGGVQPYINRTQSTSAFMQDPNQMLNVAQNPYVQGMAGALGNQAQRFFQRSVMPGLRRGSAAAGQFGGSRGQLAAGVAAGDVAGRLSDATANLFGGAYGQGLGAINQAQAMAPNIMSMGAYPGQLMQQVGQQYRDYDQQQINDAVNRFNFYQQQPDTRLDQFLSRNLQIGGLGGNTSQSGGGPNTLSRVAGGAMMGMDLGNRIGGLFGNQSFTGGLSPNQWSSFNTRSMPSLFGGQVNNLPMSGFNFN